jgi:hypothetical protein
MPESSPRAPAVAVWLTVRTGTRRTQSRLAGLAMAAGLLAVAACSGNSGGHSSDGAAGGGAAGGGAATGADS